jgi:hypothetical protein
MVHLDGRGYQGQINGTRFGELFAFLLFHWNKLPDGIVSQIGDRQRDCSQF